MRVKRRRAAIVAVVLASTAPRLAGAAPVSNPTPEVCADAFEQSQVHRSAGRLLEAHAALNICAQASCPPFLVKECIGALGTVDAAMPSIVIAVRDAAGASTVDVKIAIDEQQPFAQVPSTAIPLDPGPHRVRAISPDGTRELSIVLREGERAVHVDLSFAPEAPATSPAPRSGPPPPPKEGGSPSLTLPLVLGGISIAGFATFAALGLTTVAEEDRLRRDCAPVCSTNDSSNLKTRYFVADLALVIGIAAGTTALFTYLSRPSAR
jgi:hypothetical protein